MWPAIAAAVALGIALTTTLYAAAFRTRMLIPGEVPDVRVVLILPATGPLPGLEALFAALGAQTLPAARLIVAVESRQDPAYRRVADLARDYPQLNPELVVAGLSDDRAQKCTNILGALARLDPADSYIVLFDADIRPQPWWTAMLVGPLAAGRADIVNGYRWQVPRSVTLATALGAAVDRGIAVLPRIDGFRLLWGGSLALTRRALDQIDAPATLARALTEDLVIADRAAALGLRVMTRRALRVPTPLDGTLGAVWRFGRRQYQIVHVYRRGTWGFALGACTADLAARVTLLVAALASDPATAGIAIAALGCLGLLGSLAVELRRAIGKRLGAADPAALTLVCHLLVWAFLPIVAFHASVLWAALAYSPVAWAHVRYRVDRRGRVIGACRAAPFSRS